MTQREHLPIYKKAYDLTLYFEKIVSNFSRYDKFTWAQASVNNKPRSGK